MVRLSEVGLLTVEDVDLATESVRYTGKGARDRRVRIGPTTARAVSRYLRARAGRRGACPTCGWPTAAAGVPHLHAHRWRHTYAHEWKVAGGDTGDLMVVLGWTSDDMPRHYGASAAAQRAVLTQQRLGIGERV